MENANILDDISLEDYWNFISKPKLTEMIYTNNATTFEEQMKQYEKYIIVMDFMSNMDELVVNEEDYLMEEKIDETILMLKDKRTKPLLDREKYSTKFMQVNFDSIIFELVNLKCVYFKNYPSDEEQIIL